jgi:hypothetical protein
MDIYFGDPSECDAFVKSHSEFFKRVRDLESLLRRAFVRSFTTGSLADKVIFFLGNLCVEDFNEILLLCGNGCGSGGLKILRGMYEKCVTAGFLASLPGAEREQEAQKFVDWHHIDNWKLWNRVQDAYKDRQLLTPGRIAQMKAEYERVKKTLPPPCQKCGRGQISWSKLDLFSMAQKAGSELVELYPTCYLEPTFQTHATSTALYRRLKLASNDEITFNDALQRNWAQWALSGAHALIVSALDLQIQHFRLDELAEDKERALADYQTVWGRRPGGIEPG